MAKNTILFLAANPLGTDQLALDQEARAIHAELERSGHRDQFELVTRWAVEPLDLLRELRKLRPTIVHFSAHGASAERSAPQLRAPSNRDVNNSPGSSDGDQRPGLLLQGPDGRAEFVSVRELAATFGVAGKSTRLVVLSACHGDSYVEPLLEHVDCVVGMMGPVTDDATRSFAVGFYGGLGEGASVAAAFRQGCAAIGLVGLPDTDKPRLVVRERVDAERFVFAEACNERSQRSRASHGSLGFLALLIVVVHVMRGAFAVPGDHGHDRDGACERPTAQIT
jgi:hypothetical protein